MIVPPRGRIPETCAGPRSRKLPSTRPRQPSSTATQSQPSASEARTTARITAFRPGQSPPPVNMPMVFATRPSVLRKSPTGGTRNTRFQPMLRSTDSRLRQKGPPNDESHGRRGRHSHGTGTTRSDARAARPPDGGAARRGAGRAESVRGPAREDRRGSRVRDARDYRPGARDAARWPPEDRVRLRDRLRRDAQLADARLRAARERREGDVGEGRQPPGFQRSGREAG